MKMRAVRDLETRAGELAQGLGHEAGLQAHVGVAHFAVELGLGDQGGDGIDDQHVDGAGPDQGLGDLEGLLAGVGLGDEEVVDIDAELLGVAGVEGVLGVDKGGQAAGALGFGDDLQGDGGLAGGLGAEDLGNAAAGNAADAEGGVEADGASGDNGDGQQRFARAEPDDRPFSKLFFDLCKGKFYGFGAVVGDGHWEGSSKVLALRHLLLFGQETTRGLNWISKGL